MAGLERGTESDDVNRYLAGAAKVVAGAHYCWLSTQSAGEMPTLRPMGILADAFGSPHWLVRFLADGRSRKIKALRQFDRVAITVQNEADEAFVLLLGKALLLGDPADVRKHWRSAFKRYFPAPGESENAVFIEVHATRMELWIRRVTPEPFGVRPMVLERQSNCAWGLAS